jgi:hypothetical protein
MSLNVNKKNKLKKILILYIFIERERGREIKKKTQQEGVDVNVITRFFSLKLRKKRFKGL